MVAMFLEQGGARVTAVGSAYEAVAAIRRIRPHILVSDLAMPGMDGYALIRRCERRPT